MEARVIFRPGSDTRAYKQAIRRMCNCLVRSMERDKLNDFFSGCLIFDDELTEGSLILSVATTTAPSGMRVNDGLCADNQTTRASRGALFCTEETSYSSNSLSR
jgi:hypothetical protein